jgi:hypothetical protein
MVGREELDKLYEELRDPNSWHWMVDQKSGWFTHSSEYKNAVHVRKILEELDMDDPAEAKRLRVFLRALYESDENKELPREAIGLLIGIADPEVMQRRRHWLQLHGFPSRGRGLLGNMIAEMLHSPPLQATSFEDSSADVEFLLDILLTNWGATVEVVRKTGHYNSVFHALLPWREMLVSPKAVHSVALSLARIAAHAKHDVESILGLDSHYESGLLECKDIIHAPEDLEVLADIVEHTSPEEVNQLLTDLSHHWLKSHIQGTEDLQKLSSIAKACSATHTQTIFSCMTHLYGIPLLKDMDRVQQAGIALAKQARRCRNDDVRTVFLNIAPFKHVMNSIADLTMVIDGMRLIAEKRRMHLRLFDALHTCTDFLATAQEIQMLCNYIADHELPAEVIMCRTAGCESVQEALEKLRNVQHEDPSNYTVQGLLEKGYLTVHVANTGSQDPFVSIMDDIRGKGNYDPACTIIKPESDQTIAHGGPEGALGVIFDYGYLYECHLIDSDPIEKRTESKHKKAEKEHKHEPVPAAMFITMLEHDLQKFHELWRKKFSVKKDFRFYNEVLLRKWTIGALFYTTGIPQEAVQKLIQISNSLSFAEYMNGAYWYRKKEQVPKYRMKAFPVYEITVPENTCKIVHMPEHPEYHVFKSEGLLQFDILRK